MKLKLITGTIAMGVLMCGTVPNMKAQQNPPSADQAKNNPSDRDIMQKIRKSLMDDTSLSSEVKNVKVIAQNGKVTLKGTVPSEEDKKNVEQKATEVAGPGNVTNDLTVKPAKKTN